MKFFTLSFLFLFSFMSELALCLECQKIKSIDDGSMKIDGFFDDWDLNSKNIACINDGEGTSVHDFTNAGLGKNHDIKRICIAHTKTSFYILYELTDGQSFDTYSEGCDKKCGSQGVAPQISYYQVYMGSFKNGQSGYENKTFPGIAGNLFYQALIETAYSFNPSNGKGGSIIQDQKYNMWFDLFTDYELDNPFLPPNNTYCCHNLRDNNWKREIPILNLRFGYMKKGEEAIEIEITKKSICSDKLDCSELYLVATSSELLNCNGDDFTEPLFVCAD